MKVLVTGGCGYIGSKLAQNLAKNDLDVTVLDTFGSATPMEIILKSELLRAIRGMYPNYLMNHLIV